VNRKVIVALSILLAGRSASSSTQESPHEPPRETWTTGESQVHLVELFSSEGCSSCPPADRWLSGLRAQLSLWKEFVPVEFHVDYWNRLGWVDRFSREAFTARQSRYSSEWSKESVYTPGFVLDGEEWRPDGSQVPAGGPARKVGVLSAKRLGAGKFQVTFRNLDPSLKAATVTGAVLGNGLATEVKAGENRGSTLRHDFVVLSLASAPMSAGNGVFTAVLDLGDEPKVPHESLGFAIWVSPSDRQRPIQALGGVL
jgi:hypothetical protein